MRAIDAEALMDGYKCMGYDPSEHPEESYMEGWCKGFNSAVDHCMHHVIHAPTVEPQRKKGEWTWVPGREDEHILFLQCSVCHMCAYEESEFCPHCGADMRGE